MDLPGVRAGAVFGGLALLFAVLAGRSLYLQGIDDEFLQGQGQARYARALEVPAHRGRIVDRHGEALAISTPVKSLWAFADKLEATPAQWTALAKLLETTPQALQKQVRAADDFVYLAKRIPPETAERVLALRIKGLYDENEYRRYYPGGEVMGHVVGFTGDHDAGQEGIELAQQGWLGGRAGSRRVIINRRGDVVEDVAAIREPQAGRDLALAIDSRLQYLAFRELKAAVEQHKAKAGGLVILDTHTGEILALANWPAFNPNRFDKLARDRMRNRALTDVFEPGSTLKPFTAATALEAGTARPETLIDTNRGSLTINGATIRDAHASLVPLTFEQVDPEILERRRGEARAGNACAADVADAFRFRLRHACPRPVSPARCPAVCDPQRAGGRSNRRRSATGTASRRTSCSSPGPTRSSRPMASSKPVTLLKTNGPVAGRPVIKPETARAVRRMLELATLPGGTAPKAQVVGYRVAGKTGTAHKLEGRNYAETSTCRRSSASPRSRSRA